ncbi:hypothetical protein R1flu_018297 [Riccia fluitans]|uniref:Peptidase M14 domain-containing protein n=1 Tax=Riccia fluitans TaxID=41844 RepID=A0ABD1ZIV6_9MARC
MMRSGEDASVDTMGCERVAGVLPSNANDRAMVSGFMNLTTCSDSSHRKEAAAGCVSPAVACLAQLLLLADATGHLSMEQISAGSDDETLPSTGSGKAAERLLASEEDPMKGYRSNEELFEAMRNFSDRCSSISRVYSIGKSVRGVDLLVLEISDKPGEVEAEPAFKYVGNMHGDEPSGRELTLLLAEWLCSNYPKDPTAKLIVRNMHLHLLPSMNPDGFEDRNRNNANDVDLNRDFPDQFVPDNNEEASRQPESKAVMEWIRQNRFTASASLHEGALVVSYGWDGTASRRTGYAKAPDDGAFKYMANLYAQYNPVMKKYGEVEGGVTNGAAWYPLYGGMQDWNYIHGNCFEITLEMNEEKWPHMSKIPQIWKQHRKSILSLTASVVKSGLHGQVTSAKDGKPLSALIAVEGNSHIINASSLHGDFHRILPPGETYLVSATFPGYQTSTKEVFLPVDKPATVDFILEPESTFHAIFERHPLLRGSSWFRSESTRLNDGATNERSDNSSSVWKRRMDKLDPFGVDCIGCLNQNDAELFLINHGGAIGLVLVGLLFVLFRCRKSFRSRHSLRAPPRRVIAL